MTEKEVHAMLKQIRQRNRYMLCLDKFWTVYYRNCAVISLLLFLPNNCIIDTETTVTSRMLTDWDTIVINLM